MSNRAIKGKARCLICSRLIKNVSLHWRRYHPDKLKGPAKRPRPFPLSARLRAQA